MRGLEPALVLLAVALAAHGAWRLAAGDPAVRFSAAFDLVLAACAGCAVVFWRADGAEGGRPDRAPRHERSPAPLADFLGYALPAIALAALYWLMSR